MSSGVIFWICLAIVLGVVEVLTVNLVTLWPAIAAVLTALIAMLGISEYGQAVCFIVFSAVLLVLTRPLVKRVAHKNKVATNADRIIGAEGIVIKRIEPIENSGQVKVMGQVWSAKAAEACEIEVGSVVTVCGLEGVRAVVKVKE